jgi:hypothetical protein
MSWLIRNNLKAVAEQKILKMEIASLQIQQGWHQQLTYLGASLSSVSTFLLTRLLWHVPFVYYFYNLVAARYRSDRIEDKDGFI